MSTTIGSKVALAAPHRAAVAAGRHAVAAGGNALDAALAAATALTVVYPHQCALGGDLVALVRRPGPDGPGTAAGSAAGSGPGSAIVSAVVSAGAAPAALTPAVLPGPAMPRQGPHTVTVPGVVAGWQALAGLGARLPLSHPLRYAQGLAERGSTVTAGLRRALGSRAEAVLADPGLRALFAPDGDLPATGTRFTQPALARTLAHLADDPASFYHGEIAERLVAGLRAAGGLHTAADFAAHHAEVVPALATRLGQDTWWAAPPPTAGPLLLGVAAAASGDAARPDAARPDAARPDAALSDAALSDAALLDACLRAVQVRVRHLGDPRTAPVDIPAILALDLQSPNGQSPDAPGPAAPWSEPPARGDTVAVSASDDSGLSVVLIQSVFQTFGAGLLEPGTGIVLHNRGAAFSLDPASPARLTPGSRPPHTLCPLIVDSPAGVLAIGCQGGRAQPWILAQIAPVLLADPEQDPADVLARPRWVVGDVDLGHDRTTLVAEPGLAAVLAAARSRDLPVDERAGPEDIAGHVQLTRRRVAPDGTTRLDAASDPRADGAGELLGEDRR
ncbi:oxamate amidohydrolase [Acrocarpospora macrocephala]|uniref:Gamma-glutamyltransferase n=1 Tax=Acrocarpospora macrocephala TaxID=150177 RepID=A0A5M3WTH9_9ACTN|nr:gamma-glutamyltransferase [Acrocarpospora macrocephala]GES11562.1 gamma-glutamyltransferase [Acrocarpospora macrocephala]